MGKPRVNGTLEPVLQPLKVSYDPNSGQVISISWESAGANLGGIAKFLQDNRISYDLEPNGKKSRIVAKASGGQLGIPNVAVDEWQLTANEIQKDLREHRKARALGNLLLQAIKKKLDDVDSEDIVGSDDAIKLYDLLLRGTTHYALGQYVLRHTTNVSNDYRVNISDINIERIYTTEQMLIECGSAGGWVFPLPGRMVFKIEHIEAPASQDGYLWGWRKLPSTEHTAPGNRIAITTEYWLEQWSTFIYDTVS